MTARTGRKTEIQITPEGGEVLRVSMIAQEKEIRQLLNGLDQSKVPFRVLSLSRPIGPLVDLRSTL